MFKTSDTVGYFVFEAVSTLEYVEKTRRTSVKNENLKYSLK